MNKIVNDLINEILEIENFDLKMYYNYIDVYGKEVVLEAFDKILLKSKNFKSTYIKYFDAYFSIKLENLEINDDTYIKLTEEYGEDIVNNYFISLLEEKGNSSTIKQKYEKIYFYIDTLENSKKMNEYVVNDSDIEDSVKLYLKEMSAYPLLSADEEMLLLRMLNESKKNIKIASFDNLDNIDFENTKKVLLSIKTKEQFKKIKKISQKLHDNEDKKIIDEYIKKMNKVFKTTNVIEITSKHIYNEDYLDIQLDLMLKFINSREKLINSNLRLVVSIAKYYAYAINFEILDLISEGNIGLMRAIQKFDCEKRTKLSTYATWWIKQGITRYISECARTIRIPVHCDEKIRKYAHALKVLSPKYGEKVSNEVVAEYLGWTVFDVENIKTIVYTNTCVSLDCPVGEEDDTHIVDMIADDNMTEDIIFKQDLVNIFEEVFETITERESEIIKYRYGFYDGGRTYTLEEIGKIYGVTRERVRQVENKALRKFRHPSRAKKLKTYF